MVVDGICSYNYRVDKRIRGPQVAELLRGPLARRVENSEQVAAPMGLSFEEMRVGEVEVKGAEVVGPV
ncbi:hypothetical protein ACLOJK_009195 [Asimina triloba]